MANKGLQFEHAVMYSATSRITGERTREQEKFFTEATKKRSNNQEKTKNKVNIRSVRVKIMDL